MNVNKVTVAERDDQPPILIDEHEVYVMAGRGGGADLGFAARVASELKPKATPHVAWGKTCFTPTDARRIAQRIIDMDDAHRTAWDAYTQEQQARKEAARAKEMERRRKLQEEFNRKQAELNERQRAEAKAKADRERVEAERKLSEVQGPDFETWKKTKAKVAAS